MLLESFDPDQFQESLFGQPRPAAPAILPPVLQPAPQTSTPAAGPRPPRAPAILPPVLQPAPRTSTPPRGPGPQRLPEAPPRGGIIPPIRVPASEAVTQVPRTSTPPRGPGPQEGAEFAGSGFFGSPVDPRKFLQFAQRFPHTPAGLQRLVNEANSMGANWRIVGSHGDKIDFGGGVIVDVIRNASGGGDAWVWSPVGSGPGGGPGRGPGGFEPDSFRIPGSGVDTGGQTFDDPNTQLLEQLLRERLGRLGEPVNDPARDQLARLLQTATDRFTNPQRNPEVDTLIADLRARMDELRGAPFSAEEENIIRTGALDRISGGQDVAEQRLLEVLGSMGRLGTSGVNAQLVADQARQFDTQRSQAEGEFGRFAVSERQRRQDQALALGDAIRQLEESEIARVEEDLLQALGTAQSLFGVSMGTRGEEADRSREAMSLAGILAGMPERRLQLALQTLGMGPGPSDLTNPLLSLLGLGLDSQRLGLQHQQAGFNRSAAFGSAFGSLGNLLNPGSAPFSTARSGIGTTTGSGVPSISFF